MANQDLTHAIAGAFAGAVALVSTYPLQTVTLRLQVQRQANGRYKGTFRTLLLIMQEEGVHGLFHGINLGIASSVASAFVYYYCQAFFKRVNNIKSSKVSVFQSLSCAAFAGCCQVLVTHPLWTINAVQKLKPEEDTLTTTKDIARRDGIRGFWRGVVPALILVSNPIITWVAFEQLKKLLLLRRDGPTTLLQRREILVVSAFSKLASMIATFPYIVVKSRLQVQGAQSAPRYKGTLDCLSSIISSEGVHGLFKGFTSKVVSSVLAAVVLFLVHSEALSFAKWLRPRKIR